MERGDKRGHLRFGNVLQFVDVDGYHRFCRLRGFSDLFEQRRQVAFQVAVVGQPRFGFVIKADFDVVERDFQFPTKPANARRPRTA